MDAARDGVEKMTVAAPITPPQVDILSVNQIGGTGLSVESIHDQLHGFFADIGNDKAGTRDMELFSQVGTGGTEPLNRDAPA